MCDCASMAVVHKPLESNNESHRLISLYNVQYLDLYKWIGMTIASVMFAFDFP